MKVCVLASAFSLLFLLLLGGSSGEQCGRQNGGALCPGGLCCSEWGWCGTTNAYCGEGCQSQCDGGDPAGGGDDDEDIDAGELGKIISKELFNEMLMHRNDTVCPAAGFYTYNAFITAAQKFPAFGNTGDDEIRKREIAAFFGQTSHETTGGWPGAPDGEYAWGYCFIREITPSPYCSTTCSGNYPCANGQEYYGRGPIQLTGNCNYGQFGDYLNQDLLNSPDIVATDRVISFESAIWFWMTPQSPKPSCHDVITGNWEPPEQDIALGRLPGYGLLTNIINGGLECGIKDDSRVLNRIGFYERYCGMYGVDPGDNLDCENQTPYGSGVLSMVVDTK